MTAATLSLVARLARTAKVYDNTLTAMIAERPEIEAYRRRLAAPVIDWDKANSI